MKIISVKDLKKSYGKNQVLKGLNFEANEGEIIGVIGKNGAGKSTFLEILMTIKDFDHGEVVLFNENLQNISIDKLGKLRRDISVVLQPTQFYKSLKVEELLKLFKSYYKSNKQIEEIIADFNLELHRRTYFEKLSGGWKQKVSLAIAFLSEPKLIILDEPTTGLDPHMRNILWSYIVDYNKSRGGTVILTTHYMDEIEMYCDKVMLIEDGKNEMFESTENILSLGYRSINDFYLSKVSV
ncbi:ABC transporter ATP-binding protein [Bacillus sp. B1-b2]|uniref:ABC transporter ATP-binding protein n=1 Tax=Bacillus sp. B1-b2 TaxID=2653201 RepID=UPI00126145E4|nr:ABC transporter ATP-binding protein [Bacillus sp. B1-b2]KAB7667691.1 ABC transporter ATP-binding protein [Bacillus sp. B1-b2]